MQSEEKKKTKKRTSSINSSSNDDSKVSKKQKIKEKESTGHTQTREEDLPRGGGKLTTVKSAADLTSKAPKVELDNLFGSKPTVKKTQIKKRKNEREKKTEKEEVVSSEDELEELLPFKSEAPNRAKLITMKGLTVGMSILGCIKEITDVDLIINLPNTLKGYVSISEVSDTIAKLIEETKEEELDDNIPDLSKIFKIGQLVRCVVLNIEDYKEGHKIELTMRSSIINSGITIDKLSKGKLINAHVKSIEDHGFLLSFGLSDCSGFLSNSNAAPYLEFKKKATGDENASLEIGEPFDCLIESVNTAARSATVEINISKIGQMITKEEEVLTIESIKSGMLVNVVIRKILSNGLFVSFLDYFNGTIDTLHLNRGWDVDIEKTFKVNNKMKARIIFVDYQNKIVGLSLKSHLIHYSPFSFNSLKLGQVIEDAVVKKNQNGIGVMLDIHVSSDKDITIQGFAHVSNIPDKYSHQLDKKYTIGSTVKCRVTSLDYLDGMAIVSLKKSIINAKFLTIEDIEIGSIVEAVVSIVRSQSIIANITEHIRGMCPSAHMADVRIKDPDAKFKVGQKLKFRILDVNLQSKKVLLTHKRSLIDSELPIITKFEEASEKMITHGYITKILPNGVIVSFYGGVHGLVSSQELSVDPVICKNPQKYFKVGQVVKCKILTSNSETKKIKITLRISNRSDQEETTSMSSMSSIPVGSIVKGYIKSITKSSHEGNSDTVIWVEMQGDQRGLLTIPHLSDHLSISERLKEFYANSIGKEIEEILILSHDNKYGNIVTLKPSLIQAAKLKAIPSSFNEVQQGAIIQGYIKSIQPYGIFVGFLGSLIGMAPKSNLSDSFVSQLDSFTIGQSIRAYVSEINVVENKIVLSLKHSHCFSTDASLIASYFKHIDLIASFSAKKSKNPIQVDWGKYEIGSTIQVSISEVREFGAISKIEGESQVTGFTISHHTKGVACSQGSKVTARILDIDKEKRIIDLSFRPELTTVNSSSIFNKIHKLLSIGNHVKSTIELIKENYLIISLHGSGSDSKDLFIGFAPTRDFNETTNPFIQYKLGQKCDSTVHFIPESLSNRILCSVSRSVVSQGKRGVTLIDKSFVAFDTGIVSADELSPGMKVKAKIFAINDHFIHVALGLHLTGKIHITEVVDLNISQNNKSTSSSTSTSFVHPFESYKVGDIIDAKVLTIGQKSNTDKYLPLTHQTPASKKIIELTVRPSVMLLNEGEIGSERFSFDNLSSKKGETVEGIIHQVTIDTLWVYISNTVRGRVFVLDASDSIEELTFLQERFRPGQRVRCRIIEIDSEKKTLDLSIKAADKQSKKKFKHNHFKVGQVVIGRVAKIKPGKAITIQLSGHTYGRVHITDASDVYSSNVLSQYEELQFVKCYVLQVDKDKSKDRIYLSLRNSRVNPQLNEESSSSSIQREIEGIQELHVGDVVSGYIDCVTEKVGCFIWISRTLRARATFSELSDVFIEKPAEVFTPGKVVTCKIVSLDADTDSPKIDVSLRDSVVKGKSKQLFFDDIKVGMTLIGQIKRLERFGVFVKIDSSKLSALCHTSELDDPLNFQSNFKVGDHVKAKVISIDSSKKQFSLSLKKSHFINDEEVLPDIVDSMEAEIKELKAEETIVSKNTKKPKKRQTKEEEEELTFSTSMEIDNNGNLDSNSNGVQNEGFNISAGFEWEDNEKEKVEKELEMSEEEEEEDETAKRKSKKAKKAEKERKEREILEKERQAVEGESSPQSINDFEKLLLASPNNSFLWIKYMAYHITLNEIEKARIIGERAIKTINMREEAEKQNIWVAWLNLENTYGSQDSVDKVFNKAVSYNDPKWIYIKMLEIYEKSKKHEESEKLLKVMIKKFKESAKVWRKYAMLLLNTDRMEEFRNLVPQALKALPKRKHIPIISKFAQFEFKHGSAERGRTIFQGIVSNYPKRADIWNIYIDMELNHGDIDIIRNLFEKVTSLNLSSKKMKFFFKRYLEFEKKSGDEQTVQQVIRKAQQYIDAKTQ